jgi:hypothetical protein
MGKNSEGETGQGFGSAGRKVTLSRNRLVSWQRHFNFIRNSMGKAKQWLKRSLPAPLLRPMLSWQSKRAARQFRDQQPEQVFTHIHAENYWGSQESISGHGSEMTITANIRAALPVIFKKYEIRSMLDAPCGDFRWMQHVDLTEIEYFGGDIVKPLVDELNQRYAAPRRRFLHIDITADALPAVDLIFCRDCFIHLPFELIHKALDNFGNSSARFVLTTTFQNEPINYDTHVGGVRGIDLTAKPFELPQPIEMIYERSLNAADNVNVCMGLWPIEAILGMRKR